MYELESGSTLQGGKYRIEGVLGRGGFGITYRGSTTTKVSGELGEMAVKTPVAIKEFFMNTLNARDDSGVVTSPTQGSQDQVKQFRTKFIREARNLSGMRHPNIINVSDVFEENGTVYYVMRYLSGGSLADEVKQAGRMSEDKAVTYIRQLGSALSYLHSRKMCHLDVKPGNVLINDDGEATLIDFGIAKVFGSDGQALTDSPVTYTTHYAPLEQYQGLSDFSPQTDLYSLGATLYYLVTGQNPPLAGEVNEEGLTQKPAEVSDQVWRAIVAAMQPRRKDRPASIDIWMKMLDGIGKPLSLNNDDETVITMNSQQAMNSEETVISRKPAVDSAETVISGSARPSSSGYQQPGRPQPQPAKPQGAKPTGGKPFQPQPQKGGFNKKWLLLIPVVLVFLLVLLGGIGYGAYWYYTNHYADEEMIIETETGYSTSEAIEILDGLNLSLSRIQEVERSVYHDGTTEQEEIFERRVKALKHIYTECFLTEDHSVQRLQGVYMLRSTDLSYYQMEVLRWFFNLPASQQRQLEYLQGSIENFTDFREKVEAEIANSQNNH